MRKTIGIFAHVDAGKTTLSGQILYQTKVIREPGLYLDTAPLEKQRGITIFSSSAPFTHGQQAYTLLDTPGHVDFSTEAERCMSILDCAILVVSCIEGIEGHTEELWTLLKQYQIPVFFFCNKIDREGADPAGVLQQIQARFSTNALHCLDFVTGNPSEALIEQIAELDDTLLETYFATGYDPALWLTSAQQLIASLKLFPVFCGSALSGQGVETLLSGLDMLLHTSYEGKEQAPLCAQVYQVRYDKKGTRLAYLKLLQGTATVRQFIADEKINEIRQYTGMQYETIPLVKAGELCAVTGLHTVKAGDWIGCDQPPHKLTLFPILSVRVLFEEKDAVQVRNAFTILADEDPALCMEWDNLLQQMTIRVMGEIQLEILQASVRERFNLAVRFGPKAIRYMETLSAPVHGIGHFEPLRHYAEVWLSLSPGPRGSGITFQSKCPTDILAGNWQRLIGTHVLEKLHCGVLTGAPVTDLQITLLTGRAHIKHTEGGDFRQAVYRAIRQGLASGNSVLLEPYYQFTAVVPSELSGRLLSDITRLHGSFMSPETVGNSMIVHGRGPVACFISYTTELSAFTHGHGSFSVSFGGYEPCHNAEEVISACSYSFERDTENPADSVFCTHGAGYLVKWSDVPAHAHCTPPQNTF